MRRSFLIGVFIVITLLISYFSQSVSVLGPVNGAWVSIRGSEVGNRNFSLPGLEHNVTIEIDSSGTAHIYAVTDHDLFYAQGFYSAYMRLDQMELQAILASGNLTKFIGSAGISSDRTVMEIGLPWNAYNQEKNISRNFPSFYTLLESYSAGVNAYIHSSYYVSPLLFKLANIHPFDWSPYYSLVWQEYMSWTLTTGASDPLEYSLFYQAFGSNETSLLWPYYPYYTQNATVVPGDGTVNGYNLASQKINPHYLWSLDWVQQWATGVNTSLLGQLKPLIRDALGNISDPYLSSFEGSFIGSNSWVVGGNDSFSGSPMLANDPHLPLYAPSLWIPMQLVDTNYNVTGWSLAGEPGILIGHTADTAWGLTTPEGNSANDYLEVLNGNQYLYSGSWHNMTYVTYSLGGTPFRVYYTNNGPLIARNSQYGISLNWAASYGNSYDLLAELMLDNSTSYQQMLNALKYWGSPPQNFALVSRNHEGYITAGIYPTISERLPDGRSVLVVGSRSLLNGTMSSWEPTGQVPFHYLPQAEDPQRGYMFAPNQPTVGENYPYPFVGGYWDSGGRALSILSYLNSHQPMKMQNMMDLQSNLTDYWAFLLTPLFLNALKGSQTSGTESTALMYLSSWNHEAQNDSVGMTIYWYLLSEFDNMTYARLYQEAGLSGLPLPFPSTTVYVHSIQPDSPVFGGSLNRTVEQAFASAVNLLSQKLGGNVSDWTWGRVHLLEIRSESGIASLSLGPFPVWGDTYTVSVGGVPEDLVVPEPYVTVGSSLRFIASPALGLFYGVFPGGPSGNVVSSFYSTQLEAWISHEYYNMNNQTIVARWDMG